MLNLVTPLTCIVYYSYMLPVDRKMYSIVNNIKACSPSIPPVYLHQEYGNPYFLLWYVLLSANPRV